MAETCSPDVLLQRHKQQRKELQAKITNLKHSVPKGDKKKKREVLELVAKLEAELDEVQAQEIASSTELSEALVTQVVQNVEDLDLSLDVQDQKEQRTSRAQKRRDKKAEKERQRAQSITEQETANLFGARHLEAEELKTMLRAKGLKIYEIPPDGDCMYAAVIHQLCALNICFSVENLRKQTADFMRTHTDDFFPFLCDQDDGDMFSKEKYTTYCNNIESTRAWGGQIELRAISNILKRPIEVLQANTPAVTIGEEFKADPIILIYHRHVYSLGEHYNSVILAGEDSSEDGFT